MFIAGGTRLPALLPVELGKILGATTDQRFRVAGYLCADRERPEDQYPAGERSSGIADQFRNIEYQLGPYVREWRHKWEWPWKIVDLTGTKNGSNTAFTIPDVPDLQRCCYFQYVGLYRVASAPTICNTASLARRLLSALRRMRPIKFGLIMMWRKDKKYKSTRVQNYKGFGIFYSFTFVLF